MIQVYRNGRFYVNGSFDNSVSGLLIRDGIILELLRGSTFPSDAEVVDLAGGFVYPGFIDVHTHSFSGGLYAQSADLTRCRSIEESLAVISAQTEASQNIVFAWGFDETQMAENRYPTIDELDVVCPKRVLLLRRIDGHSCMLNSAGKRYCSRLGEFPRVICGSDNDLVVNWLHDNCDEDTILLAYHKAAELALKGGFVQIHTMIGDAQADNQHFCLVRDHLSEFPVSFILYPQSFNIKSALALGSKRIGGCILADGSIGSHTAALSKPYYDINTKGTLYQSNGFWVRFITDSHKAGLQVGVHCIGDAAIKQINDAYASLDKEGVQHLRHQLIHCELTPNLLVDEISRSGATPVMQPSFDLLWGGNKGLYEQRLGRSRTMEMNRFSSIVKSGVKVCGSSDWYVTDLSVAQSLFAAINHHNAKERLTPREAITMFTQNNAWLNHEEEVSGRIKTGFRADLSVFDTDLTQTFDYRQVQTRSIIRGGKIVYAAQN